MREGIDWSCYDWLVFVDTNVLFHFQPIDNINWGEILGDGRVLIVIVPQVAKEIDQRKRDSKLFKRSRKYHQILQKCIVDGAPVSIVDDLLDLWFVARVSVDWDTLGLDCDEADERIIGQLLSIRDLDFQKVRFLGYDARPIALARDHNVGFAFIPDKYLLPPEKSKAEVELEASRLRIKELEDEYSNFETEIAIEKVFEEELIEVRRPDRRQVSDMVERARLEQPSSGLYESLMRESYSELELREYNEGLRNYAETLHRKIEFSQNQFRLVLRIKNISLNTASEFRAKIIIPDALISDRMLFPGPWPPKPPSKYNSLSPRLIDYAANFSPVDRDKYTPYIEVSDADPSVAFVKVGNFPPSEEINIEVYFGVASSQNSELSATVEVVALNSNGANLNRELFPVFFSSVRFEDAFCLSENRVVLRPSMVSMIEYAFQSEGCIERFQLYVPAEKWNRVLAPLI